MITAELLKRFAPNCDATLIAPALDLAAARHGITTSKRICQFLAQNSEETGGFTVFSENLNYSAAALLRTWPKHFSATTAAAYAHDPQATANRAYAGRMGNGDEASGDGWRYRGRGFLQTTGRANYEIAAELTDLPLLGNPDLLLQFEPSAEVSAAFWENHGCNDLADRGDIRSITLRVNGGLLNLDHRIAALADAQAIFTPAAVGDGSMRDGPVGALASAALEAARRPAAPTQTTFTPPPTGITDGAVAQKPAPSVGIERVLERAPPPVRQLAPPSGIVSRAAPAIASGGFGLAGLLAAAGSFVDHIDFGRVFQIGAEVAAIAVVPLAFWGIWRALQLLHLSLEAKARTELLAMLARGAALANSQGVTDPGIAAASAAHYVISAAPGLLRELGVAPAAQLDALTKMAMALLAMPSQPSKGNV